MKNAALLSLLLAAGTASAQSTYTTVTDNTLNLVAGLTTLTDSSAVNANATPTQLGYITDNSWSTGMNNIGTTIGSSLAGTFGGATYYHASNSILIIGAYNPASGVIAWGSFDVRLLLSNGSYSNALHVTEGMVTLNPNSPTSTSFVSYLSDSGTTMSPGVSVGTAYTSLAISDFDTGNIGIKGIKLENFEWPNPDLVFIGVTGESAAVPEPSTYGLALGGLALAVVALRRRKKA